MQMFTRHRTPPLASLTCRDRSSRARTLGVLHAAIASLVVVSSAAAAQDDGDSEAEGDKPKATDSSAFDDSGLVRATDRSPRPGTPLIANKLFPMGLTLEITPTIDYAYSEKWISHIGGHLSLGFHIFEWLGVEAFAGGFYPRELAITTTVRDKGYSYTSCNAATDCDPKLTDLWQSFAFGGAVVEWAPLYGKLSIVSEFDLSFQLYFVGGAAIEATAKPVTVVSSTVNNNNDFYPGLLTGKQFNYNPRISAAYGAGLRLIPWKWVAFRLELRNLTGLNPPVPGYEDEQPFDISNLPLLTFGISLLI
jgi:outer membrane beta-barrel protein